jgi:hypothetical protein
MSSRSEAVFAELKNQVRPHRLQPCGFPRLNDLPLDASTACDSVTFIAVLPSG